MTSKILTLAATALSVVWLCAAPATPVQAAEPRLTAVAVTDPARLAVETEIITNLHMVDVFILGAKQGFLEDETVATWPQADKDRFLGLFDLAMIRHKPAMIRQFAAANFDGLTMDQINNLLTLSRIAYFQQIVLSASDSTIHPDESTMTAKERAFVEEIATADYAINFLSHMSPGQASEELQAALEETLRDFQGKTAT